MYPPIYFIDSKWVDKDLLEFLQLAWLFALFVDFIVHYTFSFLQIQHWDWGKQSWR